MFRPQLLASSRHLGTRVAPRAGRLRPSQLKNAVPTLPVVARRAYSDSVAAPNGTKEPSGEFRKFSVGPSYDEFHSLVPVSNRLWLRDACQCTKCVDPDSGQKTFATTDLASLLRVDSAKLADDGSLSVAWDRDVLSGGQLHFSVYPPEVLELLSAPRRKRIDRILWNRAILKKELDNCRISYDDWMAGGEKFWNAFAFLHKTGIIFVHGVPESETSVEEIGRQIGELQQTFYGLTWDVVSKPQAENVAYTSRFLGLHQDLLYYNDAPRIQLLHCISNDAKGGESLFSDGVRAAVQMQVKQPKEVHFLSNAMVGYHYEKNGHYYSRERPTISKDKAGAIHSVWWSPPFQDKFPRSNKLNRWHSAAKEFKGMIESDENMYEYKMQPGECVVFDNWRVLHGRQHFTTGRGKRWLKGTYVSDQIFKERTKKLEEEFSNSSHWQKSNSAEVRASETQEIRDQLGLPPEPASAAPAAEQ